MTQQNQGTFIPPVPAVPAKEAGTELATTTEQQMIQSIAQIAADPNTDVEKVEKMLNIQIRMMDRQAKMDYDQALARLQAEMPRIKETGEIKNKAGHVTSRYMKYEDIDRVIRPLLKTEGFSLMHDRKDENGKMIVTTILKHKNGHQEAVNIPLPYDQANALKNQVQAAVSTFSYGKRVNVCSLLNIVAEGEDDDGQMSDANKITEQQAADIKQRLQELYEAGCNVDTRKFLAYIGADSVDEIPAAKYETADDLLRRKEKVVEEGGAA